MDTDTHSADLLHDVLPSLPHLLAPNVLFRLQEQAEAQRNGQNCRREW